MKVGTKALMMVALVWGVVECFKTGHSIAAWFLIVAILDL